jgi:predicted dehydrogenase
MTRSNGRLMESRMSKKSEVRIGLIGLGVMGDLYARIYAAHPLAELAAVSSRRPAKLAEFEGRFGAKGYLDYHEMIDREALDAVVIATPDDTHFEPAKAALLARRHVLIEKPLTTTVSEADELVRLASAQGLKMQVTFNHRWLPPYQQAKQTIAKGDIGAPLAAFARKNDTIFVPTEMISWAAKTTPAWFLSSHDIDLIRWLFASEPVEARAWGRQEVLKARGIPTYDLIQAQVRFANGAIATFESGWIYPNTFPTIVDSFIEVIGVDGHIHLDRKRESVEVSTPKAFTYPKNFIAQEIFGRIRGAFPACLEDFLYSIIDGTEPHVTGYDGRQVTATLEAIHQSLVSDTTVTVAPFAGSS